MTTALSVALGTSAPEQKPPQLPVLRGSLDLFEGSTASKVMDLADLVSKSALIPEHFRGKPSDCFIALYRAHRLGCDPFGFMEQTYVVKGKLGYMGQLIIAVLNNSGKFSTPIAFEYSDGPTIRAAGKDRPDRICRATATLKASGAVVTTTVSLGMAVENGWDQTPTTGKQWHTLTDLRLAYRASTFLGRLYAPDVVLGMQATDELEDISDGSYTDPSKPGKPLFPSVSDVSKTTPAPVPATQPPNPAPDTPPLGAVVAPGPEAGNGTPAPEPTLEAKRAAFLEVYGTDAEHDMAIRFFRQKEWIPKGGVLSDMDDGHIDRAYKTREELLRFYTAWKKTAKPENGGAK
jgi:hypothetical protein